MLGDAKKLATQLTSEATKNSPACIIMLTLLLLFST
jgi:hypothetical protein